MVRTRFVACIAWHTNSQGTDEYLAMELSTTNMLTTNINDKNEMLSFNENSNEYESMNL